MVRLADPFAPRPRGFLHRICHTDNLGIRPTKRLSLDERDILVLATFGYAPEANRQFHRPSRHPRSIGPAASTRCAFGTKVALPPYVPVWRSRSEAEWMTAVPRRILRSKSNSIKWEKGAIVSCLNNLYDNIAFMGLCPTRNRLSRGTLLQILMDCKFNSHL